MSSACKFPQFCEGMEQAIDETADRAGFSSVTTINTQTGKTRLIGIRYCGSNKRKDGGVMLNFCPFCGTQIDWWECKP